MKNYDSTPLEKTERISMLVRDLYAKMPEIEAARAELITESYKQTEGQPIIMRRARAFEHILKHIPIIIRPGELIVGSSTIAPRGCQTYPEFSYEWLEAEFETVEHRPADPFYIGKGKRQVSWRLHIWRLKLCALWNIICSLQVITFITELVILLCSIGRYWKKVLRESVQRQKKN